MSVPAAGFAILLIWSTAPLAVKWSSQGIGFLFGAFGRMSLAALCCLALMLVLRQQMPWHRQARRTYAAASISSYGAMLCVYWSVQFVPSGLVSVLFGLTPLVTALLARWLLGERRLTPARIAGMMLGLVGLIAIFGAGLTLGRQALAGIAVLLVGVVISSLSMVLVKRDGAALPPLAVSTGSMIYASLLFLLTWLLFDGRLPTQLPTKTLESILYLGVIASTLGFTLFYYILRYTSASGVALITVVTPVTALLLGRLVDHEQITPAIYGGTALVLSGLALHQWGHRLPVIRSRQI
ncbi:MAG: DMT family transporter [Gammaproteobacteria bacterium]|nr:DMT family transporter [Gammaproteobacteria bacterium]